MELASGLKLPPHNHLFHGYLQFEALVQHDYKYSCINCGSHPPVIIMDLHKKGVFSMPGNSTYIKPILKTFVFFFVCNVSVCKVCWFPSAVSEVPDPTEYTGEVNIKDFWESVSLNIISLGFVKGKTWIFFLMEVNCTQLF